MGQAYVGPHWAKRVTFLGTAPSPGGHVGCTLGLCWFTLSDIGGPSWAIVGQEVHFQPPRPIQVGMLGAYWACLGLRWATWAGDRALYLNFPSLPSHNAMT